jgi:hypothetical protein
MINFRVKDLISIFMIALWHCKLLKRGKYKLIFETLNSGESRFQIGYAASNPNRAVKTKTTKAPDFVENVTMRFQL